MMVQTAWAPGNHQGVDRRFHPIPEAELSKDIFQMTLDRGRADPQIRGNFFVSLCARYEIQNSGFRRS
jgi:hypothetical protein